MWGADRVENWSGWRENDGQLVEGQLGYQVAGWPGLIIIISLFGILVCYMILINGLEGDKQLQDDRCTKHAITRLLLLI